MFGSQRLDAIKKIIKEKKHVDVSYLSDILMVSEVTIRRDLNKLEESGFLVRSFGGASLNLSQDEGESSTSVQPTIHAAPVDTELLEIGQIALRRLVSGDVVFIGSGDECESLASAIPNDMPLTVVTNSLRIAHILSVKRSISVLVTGGTLSPDGITLNGAMLMQSLQGICLKSCFVCVDGLSLERGYSMTSFESNMLIRYLRENVSECYAMASRDKIGKNTTFILGDLSYFPCLITSYKIDESLKGSLFSSNIRLYTALS